MTENILGNIINLSWGANELSSNIFNYTLPDGYSFQEIIVIAALNVGSIEYFLPARNSYNFPVVSGNSPCSFRFQIDDITKSSNVKILITKFGQKPYTKYFEGAFEPILVTGKDGEEYNMIPSDQFK